MTNKQPIKADWYPNLDNEEQLRFWDGEGWTDRVISRNSRQSVSQKNDLAISSGSRAALVLSFAFFAAVVFLALNSNSLGRVLEWMGIDNDLADYVPCDGDCDFNRTVSAMFIVFIITPILAGFAAIEGLFLSFLLDAYRSRRSSAVSSDESQQLIRQSWLRLLMPVLVLAAIIALFVGLALLG